MNKIFLFDIDGTLSDKGIIPASAKLAISLLREQNYLVLLATGRCLGQMTSILKELPVDGAILNNGALAIINQKIIFESPISIKTIMKMNDRNYALGLLTMDSYVRLNDNPIYQEFIDYFTVVMPSLVNKDYLKKHPVYSLGVYQEDLSTIQINDFPDLRFVKVCKIGYDVVNKDIHKASCFSKLRELYPGAELIAFGDNLNDLEMLKASDISVVMPTAPEEVLKQATYIADPLFEDGIYKALKKVLKVI